MLRFKSYIEEEIVSRIDHGPSVIKKFDKPVNTHFSKFGSSGVGKKVGNLGPEYGPGQVKKRTFASDLKKSKMGNAYAVPRDKDFIYHHNEKTGKHTVHMDQDTHNSMKKHTVTISHFKKKDFEKSNMEHEYISSKKNLTPFNQKRVNSLDHLKRSGINIKVHKDNAALQKAGKKYITKNANGEITTKPGHKIQGEGEVGF